MISPNYSYDRKFAPSRCLLSNIGDMGIWLLTHLNGGAYKGRRILRTESQAKLWQPLEVGAGFGYSWGWLILKYGEQRLIVSVGRTGGSQSDFRILPEKGLGLLSIGNYMNSFQEEYYVFDFAEPALSILLEAARS